MNARGYYPNRLVKQGKKPLKKRITHREIESWEDDELVMEKDRFSKIARNLTQSVNPLDLPREVVTIDTAYSGRVIHNMRWLTQQSIELHQSNGGIAPPDNILN